jgi:hypothetical protein
MTLKDSANALQLLLKDFDFRRIDFREKSQEEVEAMASAADLFYTSHFKNELDMMIYKQMEWVNANGTDEFAIQMGRGMVSSLLLLREWFETQVSISRSNTPEKKSEATIDNVLQPLE